MCDNNDGLESQYDLIVYGTGMCEAIISCAAGKAGLKVLHLDRNDYYGDKYNAHSLSSHLELFSTRKTSDAIASANAVRYDDTVPVVNDTTDFLVADFKTVAYSKLPSSTAYVRGRSVRTDMDVNKVHPSCFGYAMEHDSESESNVDAAQVSPTFHKYIKHNQMTTLSRILCNKNRDFNIDCTSKLVLGTGLCIDALISSGVHKYLEFKSIEALSYYLGGKEGLWKVPCSRGDVFNTQTLNPLEKRVFMKFYSFVLDYGRDVFSGKDVSTLNENELASGRSLYRPQNKDKEYSGFDVHKYMDLPFEDFLTSCKLSPKLQAIVMYPLCFRLSASKSSHPADAYPTALALQDLYAHINSLGRFGDTAFLTPLYGCSEIVQAYCRMSAVWGSTFMLRTSLESLSTTTSTSVVDGSMSTTEVSEVTDSNGRSFKCKAFVCNLHHFPSSGGPYSASLPVCYAFAVTRICVCWGYLLNEERGIAILPPNSVGKDGVAVGNTHAVHVSQSDHSASSSCKGATVLHITTVVNLSAEAVVRSSQGTVWKSLAQEYSEAAVQLMDRVVALLQTLVPTQRTLINQDESEGTSTAATTVVPNDFQVWTNATTLSPLYRERTASEVAPSSGSENKSLPTNLGLCYDTCETFHFNDVVEKAKRIFNALFPGKEFLPDENTLQEGEEGEAGAEGENGVEVSGVTRKIATGEQTEEELETQLLEATLSALQPVSAPVVDEATDKSESS